MSTAAIFPGQGAQSVGMGKAFIDANPAASTRFEQASEILGVDLATICFDGPKEELTRSDIAQPAIFTVSAIAWEHLLATEGADAITHVAGLSSGEWAALFAAGVVSFEDAIRILQARGRFMQTACEATEGGMLAVIGLEAAVLDGICEQAGIHVANFNSPAQTVLSGAIEGIDKAEPLAKDAGAKLAKKLAVAGAFHSPLMALAEEDFARFLESVQLNDPKLPVLSNVTGGPHDTASLKENMAQQITSSVRWVENVQAMQAAGVTRYIECGPGKVLSRLVPKTHEGAETVMLNKPL